MEIAVMATAIKPGPLSYSPAGCPKPEQVNGIMEETTANPLPRSLANGRPSRVLSCTLAEG